MNEKPDENYRFIDYARRVDVIYESFTHGMAPLDITKKYHMKYNTVRCIVNNFKTNHRVNIKKKISGYSKKKKSVSDASNNGMVIGQNMPLNSDTGNSKATMVIIQDMKPTKNAKRKPIHVCKFVTPGPQTTLDLSLYNTKCPFGLFVA